MVKNVDFRVRLWFQFRLHHPKKMLKKYRAQFPSRQSGILMMTAPLAASVLLMLAPSPYAVLETDSQYHCPFHLEDEKDLTSWLKRIAEAKPCHVLGTIPGTKLALGKLQFPPFSGNAEDRHKYTSKEAENCAKSQHPCAADKGWPITLDCAQNSFRNSKEYKSNTVMPCKAFRNSRLIFMSICLSVIIKELGACACPRRSPFLPFLTLI